MIAGFFRWLLLIFNILSAYGYVRPRELAGEEYSSIIWVMVGVRLGAN